MYDGLPDRRLMLRVWLQVMLLEDVPQFTIQVKAYAEASYPYAYPHTYPDSYPYS